ncbi:hypothetical protein VMCG_06397 [Cytospora schulzeri]|uniref:Uncharacterized protein n=1 Tax=Cytospora schulzeri TaxID=448051 RepID=A0A423W810_9PEZI|nr:hypothetical protein VMCG_06397 [Valsa malicola]
MSPQRPFLSSFFAAFRQQPPSSLPSSSAPQPTTSSTTSTSTSTSTTSPNNKQPSTTSTTSYSVSTNNPSPNPRGSIAAQAAAAAQQAQSQSAGTRGVTSPRNIPIPQQPRRRGSDSSSEGFREVLGADKMYIGGRTAAGEEKYFKLGMVRRVRSGDRLSLDRLSL